MSITHEIRFDQGLGSRERSIVFRLSDRNTVSFWREDKLEGQWTQSTSDPAGIDLYPDFSLEDRKRLLWRWDRSQHGGLIQVGIDTSYRTVKGRTVESFYKSWFSFRGAKRFVSGQFRVAGGAYPGGDGIALCELAGSSDTFQQGEGRWSVIRYSWQDKDDDYDDDE